MQNNNKEIGKMTTIITMTPVKKLNKTYSRKTLSDIREKALQRRKEYSSTDYNADEENQFFEVMEYQIYKQIVSEGQLPTT